MGVLEEVMNLKNKGISDKEIISSLREQGASPREISDALSQAKIKNAVSSESGFDRSSMEPSIGFPESAEELPTEGEISDEDLTPVHLGLSSPMHKEAAVEEEEEYVPQPIADFTQNQQQASYAPPPQYAAPYQNQQQEWQQTPPEYNQQEWQQTPQDYSQQGYYPQEGGYEYQAPTASMVDTDTVIEISEQVFADKMRKAMKQLEDLNEFKVLSETKIENVSERLKRIEASIDRLQMAVIDRVGAYGKGLDTVKKEMEMMQDSFGKVIGHAAEKHHSTHHKTHEQHHKTHEHATHQHHTTQHTESKHHKHSKKK